MAERETTTDIAAVPVGPGDAAVLAPIHAASFVLAWNEASLARLLGADAATAFAAFSGYERTPLGFVLAFAAAGEAEILTITVAQSHRRGGIGTKLLRALVEQLAEDGVERLFLEVAADNSAAYGLYRRLGFVETGRRKGYYQRDNTAAVDALTLALTLPPPKKDGSSVPRSPTGH